MHLLPLSFIFSALALTSALPSSRYATLNPRDTTSIGGKSLRIQPLGDSITHGYLSSDNNGYRRLVYSSLISSNAVNMIGSNPIGTMPDPDNEGHNGALIDEIAVFAKNSTSLRPNVIFLHAGTNDIIRNLDVANAPTRLSNLISQLVTACPDAAILVAKIIRAADTNTEARIEAYNVQVEELVRNLAGTGKKVALLDQYGALAVSDLKDGVHPTDAGYDKMARIWLKGLNAVNQKGWITAPVDVGKGVP